MIKCFHCPALLDTALELKSHFTTEHEVGRKVKKDNKCSICLKVINKSHDLQRHRITIHAFECQFCPSKFVLKRDMYEHIKSVHPNQSQVVKNIVFECQFCPIRFVKKEDLKEHVTSVHSFKCKFCPFRPETRFTKKEDLDGHVSLVVTPICFRSFLLYY